MKGKLLIEIKRLYSSLGIPFIILLVAFILSSSTWIPLAFFSVLICGKYLADGLRIDKNGFIFVIFSLSFIFALYIIGDPSVKSIGNFLCLLFAPIGCYLYGKSLVPKLGSLYSITIFLFLLGLCFTSHIYYNVLMNIAETGSLVNIKRVIDLSGEGARAATLYGLIASYGFAGLPILFFYKESRTELVYWFLGVLTIMSLMVTFHLLNRTGVIVLAGSIILASMSKSNFRVKRFIPLIMLVGVVVVLLMTQTNFMDSEVVSGFADRNEHSDIADAGGRFHRWGDALSKLWMYPIGWKFEMYTYNEFVHNFWLDVARQSGWIPFITSIILSVNLVLNSYRLVKRYNTAATAYFFSLVCCILLSASVEPVMEGCTFIFYLLSLLLGMSQGCLNVLKKRQL